MRRRRRAFLVVALAGGCTSLAPPRYDGLGCAGRKVSTEHARAQDYFDQGLTLCWGFNHDEAARSFEEAARLDPELAMVWWGIAAAGEALARASVHADVPITASCFCRVVEPTPVEGGSRGK